MKVFSFAVAYGNEKGTETLMTLEGRPSLKEFIDLIKDSKGSFEKDVNFFVDVQEGDKVTPVYLYDTFKNVYRVRIEGGDVFPEDAKSQYCFAVDANDTELVNVASKFIELVHEDNFFSDITPLIHAEHKKLVDSGTDFEDAWSAIQYKDVYIDVNFFYGNKCSIHPVRLGSGLCPVGEKGGLCLDIWVNVNNIVEDLRSLVEQRLEEEEFTIHISTEDGDIEIESWTSNKVNMIFNIDMDDYTLKSGIEKYISDFDIDEEVSLHWKMKGFSDNFTMIEASEDFQKYIDKLESCLSPKVAELTTEEKLAVLKEEVKREGYSDAVLDSLYAVLKKSGRIS